MSSTIKIKVIYEGETHHLETKKHAYTNLMMWLFDELVYEDFGDCRGTGRCGTCLIEVLEEPETLTGLDRNEVNTLNKMNIEELRTRLACQLLVNESLNGIKIKIL